MKNILQQYLDTIDSSGKIMQPTLLAMHSTSCLNAEHIFRSGVLSTKFCDVLKEELLYFFYGKPSYLVAADIERSVTQYYTLPCCFLFNIYKLPLYKLFPFDSGALAIDHYRESELGRFRLSDFLMDSSIDTLLTFISHFYGSNKNYIQGKCVLDSNADLPIEVALLASHLSPNGRLGYDGRCNTVEIICRESIRLADALVAVVVPERYMDKAILRTFKQKHPGVVVRGYYEHYPVAPSLLNEAIFQLVCEMNQQIKSPKAFLTQEGTP